jgi:hypothetical protein
MINNTTDNKKNQENSIEERSKPIDEFSSMYIRGFVTISDPESGEVIVKTAN